MTEPRFEQVRTEAASAVTEGSPRSVYVGIVHEAATNEYYFANDTDTDAELQEAAADQLGMLLRVLADRSGQSVEDVADLATDRAESMALE